MDNKNNVIAKLNIAKYPAKLILNKPEEMGCFDELDYDASFKQESYDFIFIFVYNLEELKLQLRSVTAKQAVRPGGYLYFAYPKKNNPKYKEYIDRDSLLPGLEADEEGYIPGSPLKFARMVSLDDVFTVVGLKFQDKPVKKTAAAKSSQRVGDYVARIPDIQGRLGNDPDILDKYNGLTPGYQKDWARYIYSAKKQETQDKRLDEMKEVLAAGYKSIELYKQRQG